MGALQCPQTLREDGQHSSFPLQTPPPPPLPSQTLNTPHTPSHHFQAAIKRLESIVHPLVTAERGEWLRSHAASARGSPVLLVLDIPLLYETGAQADVDAVAVVSAGPDAQRQRVLARPGMVASKFEAILARQVPDANKRALSDYVIDTVGGVGWGGARGARYRVGAIFTSPPPRPLYPHTPPIHPPTRPIILQNII